MSTQTLPAPANGVKPADPLNTLRGLLEKSKQQIAMALPKHLTPERMIRMALTAFHRTPQLQKCTPLSILGCIIQASELGLELSGPLGQAYMVPRWNKNIKSTEACFQVGYRGLIDLAMRSNRVDSIPLRIVYVNDLFEYAYGTRQYIKHVPSEEGPPPAKDASLPYPDNVKAVYCVLNLKGSTKPDFEVMTTAQIEAHRRRFSPDSYKGDYSPWLTSWEAMAMKTPCRKLAKRFPISVEFQRAAIVDEYGESGVPQGLMIDMPAGELPAPPTGRQSLRNEPAPQPSTEPSDDDSQPSPPEPTAEQEQAQMELQNFIDDAGQRLQTADREGDVEEVRQLVQGANWIPEGYRTTLLDRCSDRSKQLSSPAPAPSEKKSRRF